MTLGSLNLNQKKPAARDVRRVYGVLFLSH